MSFFISKKQPSIKEFFVKLANNPLSVKVLPVLALMTDNNVLLGIDISIDLSIDLSIQGDGYDSNLRRIA